VEGTFLSGAAVFAILIHHGVNAWIALVASFLVGFLFGTLTGILHVKLRIRPLLCGILVSTALLTVNLIAVSAGMTGDFSGESTSQISYGRGAATLDNVFPINLIPPRIPGLNLALRELILFALLAILFKYLLDWFLSTKRGMLLRATGSNDRFVTTLAKDCGNSKILGLGIGNAYAAVAGALYTHISGNVNQSMGTGTIVIGLASLIIGLSVFKRVRFLRPSTKVILGALLYQLCLTVAQKMGVPSAYNKLIMAVLFTGALLLSRRGRAAKQAAAGRE
jgi:putative ABC transport system permease protein